MSNFPKVGTRVLHRRTVEMMKVMSKPREQSEAPGGVKVWRVNVIWLVRLWRIVTEWAYNEYAAA